MIMICMRLDLDLDLRWIELIMMNRKERGEERRGEERREEGGKGEGGEVCWVGLDLNW